MKFVYLSFVVLVSVSIVNAGVVPSATFISNWNGDTGNSGLDGDYSAGSVVAQAIEGVPGPTVIASGKYGAGAINLTDVSPTVTSANNPSLSYSAFYVVDQSVGSAMFWSRFDNVVADDEMRFFYTGFPGGGAISLTKNGSDSLDRVYLTINDGTSQYLYISGAWSVLNDGAYHHIAITWDNTTHAVAMYIHDANGTLELSNTAIFSDWNIGAPDSNTVFWVADNAYHARGANGVLDDYVISSKALTLSEIEISMVGEVTVPVSVPAFIPSATFIANWNGDTGNSGLDGDYPAGSAVAQGIEGVPGPTVRASGKYGAGSIELADVFPQSTSADNPSIKYFAQNIADPNTGTVMFWVRHGTIPADDEMRYFYAEYPVHDSVAGYISFTKNGTDALDRLYLAIRDGGGAQHLYISGGWSAINDNQWHYLSITWDNSTDTVCMYIHDKDGNLQLSNTAVITHWSIASPDAGSYFWVADNNYHSRGVNGVLDDYVISSKALTLSEIETSMAGEAAIPPPGGTVIILK